MDTSNLITFGFIISAILGAIAGVMVSKAKILDLEKLVEGYENEQARLAVKIAECRNVLNLLSAELGDIKENDDSK